MSNVSCVLHAPLLPSATAMGSASDVANLFACSGQVAMNQEAVRLLRRGDADGAARLLDALLGQAGRNRRVVRDVHVVLGNRSAALLALGRPHEAVDDSLAAFKSIEQNAAGVPLRRCSGYAGTLRRLGDALLACNLPVLAQDAYEEGLMADPTHAGLRKGLQAALTAQQLEQQQQQEQALGNPSNDCALQHKRPTLGHSCAGGDIIAQGAAQALVHWEGKLVPSLPLSPKQAQVDVVTRDTLNYLTTKCDVHVPRQLLAGYLADATRMHAVAAAIKSAVLEVTVARNLDCRVLVLGGGMGVLPLIALRAGAVHVTVVERWLYAALACKELLEQHGIPTEQYTVLHTQVTDVQLGKDMPVCANLVVADALIDEGLLTSGFSACVRHAMSHLTTPDALIMPERLDVCCQAVQATTPIAPGGIELSALDGYRRCSLLPGNERPLMPGAVQPLTPAHKLWTWSCYDLPAGPETQVLDLQVGTPGCFNAVMCWANVTLYGSVGWTTYDKTISAKNSNSMLDQASCLPSVTSLQPVLHYLARQHAVMPGMQLHLAVTHDTARLDFGCLGLTAGERHDHQRLVKPLSMWPGEVQEDPSLERSHFCAAADTVRLAAYSTAMGSAIQQLLQGGQQAVHVLDVHAGSGVLGCMAAHQGAGSVTCVEAHPTLACVARRTAALNGLADKVCVVHGSLEDVHVRHHVPSSGCNLVVADINQANPLDCSPLGLLSTAARQRLLQPDMLRVLPAKLVLYGMGLQVLNTHPAGSAATHAAGPAGMQPSADNVDMLLQQYLTPLSKYRWTDRPEAVQLHQLPHTQLTPAFALWEIDLLSYITGEGGPAIRVAAQPSIHPASVAAKANNAAGAGDMCFVKEGRGGGLMMQVPAIASGTLDAVLLWYDLHLDEHTKLTSAPAGYGYGGEALLPEGQGAAAADAVPQQDADKGAAAADAVPQNSSDHSATAAAPGGSRPDDVQRMLSAGQLLQFTQHVLSVQAGDAVQLVAQRQSSHVVVDVRATRGSPAQKPPWKEEWGGGVSIENPHVQRVKYCDLLEAELMQRLPSGRGPSVEQDVKHLARHCGSLQLHPPAVRASLQHLSLLERLYRPCGRLSTAADVNLPASMSLPNQHMAWAVAVQAAKSTNRQQPSASCK